MDKTCEYCNHTGKDVITHKLGNGEYLTECSDISKCEERIKQYEQATGKSKAINTFVRQC